MIVVAAAFYVALTCLGILRALFGAHGSQRVCHGNFGPAEKLVRGTKISGISVRADHFFLKILVPP